MRERALFVDATVFLGMHHEDVTKRNQALGFFSGNFRGRVFMNYEQVGICDAVIWRQNRHTQDLYYPFMDRLHSDMDIVRGGYHREDLEAALRLDGLEPEQALLLAQVVRNDAVLATHDPKLLQHPLLNEHRWRFGDEPAPALPAPLQALYQDSLAFVYRGWSHA